MQQDETTDGVFLVCGLGNLGQFCIALLKEFGAVVNAIEITENRDWQIPDFHDSLDKLVIGDCRQPNTLEQAGIYDCRGILIVTGSDRVNIATAFAARSLNPNIRVVIRSGQEKLNSLLEYKLGNFAAFGVTTLPAKSFALAALGTETQGRFDLENKLFKVVRVKVDTPDSLLIGSQLRNLNNNNQRVLVHARHKKTLPKLFYKWAPDTRIRLGDTIAYIEIENYPARTSVRKRSRKRFQLGIRIKWQNLKNNLIDWWGNRSQTERLAVIYAPFIAILFALGTVFYWSEYRFRPGFTWQDAINDAVVLVIGGFDNMFGMLQLDFKISWWLYLFSLFLTIAGTAFTTIFYTIINERLLSYRFQFSIPASIPKSDHVVVVGLGRLGQKVARFLQQEYKQPVVGINLTEIEPNLLPHLPVVIGNIKQALKKVNIESAKSVIAVTDDEALNLEIALEVEATHPAPKLAICTFDPRFHNSLLYSEVMNFDSKFHPNIDDFLHSIRVINVYEASADVFVAAAFGQNIVGSFRFNHETNLVTEYIVKDNDSLNCKLLAEVAYGYGIVPILYQDSKKSAAVFMPSDDIRLSVGDRLVAVGNILWLRRVEQGVLNQKNWLLDIEEIHSQEVISKAAKTISRISGCDINVAKTVMSELPQTLPVELYQHQAQRLVTELRKFQIVARITKNNKK